MVSRFANIVLGGASFFCLSLLALLFTRHGWTTHYLVLIVLAGIFWGSRRLPVPIRRNVALLLCSLLFSCYLAEVVLALKSASKQQSFIGLPWLPDGFGENESFAKGRAAIAREHHTEFDTRNKLTVVMDLRKQGLDAWPEVPAPATYKGYPTNSSDPAIAIEEVGTMPLGGIADKVTVYCNENGAYTIYSSDEHGFHNPKGLWQLSRVDIAAVGDSFVLGACVPSDKNFVALVRQQYPKTLNVGRDGNGPLSELAAIKKYLSFVKPKFVFWFYYERNDLREDLVLEKRNPILRGYLNAGFSQRLFGKQAAIDRALKEHINTAQHSQTLTGHLQNIISQDFNPTTALENLERIAKFTNLREGVISAAQLLRGHPPKHDPVEQTPAPEEDIRLFTQVLAEGQQSVQAWGGTMVFVYLPSWARYFNVKYANKDREQVLAVVRSHNIPMIDLETVFHSHRDPLSLFPFRESGHYTEEGNHLVAGEVLRFLDRSRQHGLQKREELSPSLY